MDIPPLVWVRWEDAAQKEDGVWMTHSDKTEHKYEPAIMCTVGFLLHEDEKGVILTHTWNEDCMSPRDQIPFGMIQDMGILVPQKKSSKCK